MAGYVYSGQTSSGGSTTRRRRKNKKLSVTVSENGGYVYGPLKNNKKSSDNYLANQTANYKTRLAAAGVDDKDTRNFLEKKLNLPEKQNILFDIGDILDRPANAIRGAIKASQEGKDAGEAAKKGLTGEKQYYFGDVLRNAGVSDKKLFKNPLNKKGVSAADIGGTALDIVADPLNLIGVGEVGKGLKVAQAAKELSKAEKALKTVKASKKAATVAEDMERAAQITKATNRVNEAKKTYNTIKNTKAPRMSLLEGMVQGTAYGTKKVAKGVDKLVTAGLEKSKQRQINKLIKKGASQDLINKKVFKADLYKGAKKGIANTLDYSKALPNNLMNDIKASNEALDAAANTAIKMEQNAIKTTEDFVKTSKDFKNADEVNKAINVLRDSKKSKDTNLAAIFKRTSNDSKYKIEGTTDSIKDALVRLNSNKQIADLGITFKVEDAGNGLSTLRVEKGKSNLRKLKTVSQNQRLMEQLQKINITRNSKLTEEETARLAKYQDLYENNDAFRKLYDEAEKLYPDYSDAATKATGGKVNLKEITEKGIYNRKEISENALKAKGIDIGAEYAAAGMKGNAKAFGKGKKGKYTDYSAEEANTMYKEKLKTVAERKRAERDNIINKLPENQQKEAINKLTKIKEKRITYETNFDTNLAKAELSAERATELKKKIDKQLDDLSTISSEKIKTKIKNIANPNNADGYAKATREYINTYNALVDNVNKITEKGLSASEAKKLSNEILDLSNKIEKQKNKVDFQKAKLEGAITQKAEREAAKVARDIKKSSELTERKIKASKRENAAASKVKNLKEVNESTLRSLRAKEAEWELQVENLDPTLPKNVELKESLLKRERKLSEEISLLETEAGKDLFTNSYFGGFENYVKESSEQAKTLNAYTKVMETGLYDDRVMQFIPKGAVKTRTPIGYRELKSSEISKIVKYLNSYKNMLPESSRKFLKEFEERIGESQSIVMNNAAYDLLKIGTDNNAANIFLKAVNGATNTFKKYSTFSPGFQMRNFTGNISNMWLSGVPMPKIAQEMTRTNKLLNNKKMWNLLIDDAKGTLKASDKEDVELLKDFINAGFLGQGSKVRDLQEILNKVENSKQYEGKLKKLVDSVFELNVKANEWLDSHSRMTVLSYAKKHPEYVQKLGAKDPIDAVKKVVFDPSNMSPWEKNFAKKAIPFYTFTKQNLMFQASNIMKNTSRYNNLLRTFREAYGSLDENQYRDYQKESMQIPLYTDKKGNLVTLKSNLPTSDLGEWASDPLRRLISSSTSLVKVPYEAVTGIDTFTGQKSNKTPIDYLASVFGLSNAERIPDRLSNISTKNTAGQNFANLFGSVASYNDAEKIANSNEYQEFLDYQNYINDLKKQGVNIPTITELRQQGIDVDAIRDSIANDKSALKKLKKRREEIQKSLGY